MQKHSSILTTCALLAIAAFDANAIARAEEAALVEAPVAILPFQERGDEVKGMGAQAADLLFARLAAKPELILVDREDLRASLEEQELNLSGLVDSQEAVQIGQLTGAQIFVTGSVLQVENSLYVVAKIIGVETTRVLGASAEGAVADGLDDVVTRVADDVAVAVGKNVSRLTAPHDDADDRIDALTQALGDAQRPSVRIEIDERHVGQETIDPAAETEMMMWCGQTGFVVVDAERANAEDADVLIQGEGVSEFAARRGNLISVKARLEIKAIDRKTNEVIAVDRQTCIVVDLTEELAGKKALENASSLLAERLLPKLVTKGAASK